MLVKSSLPDGKCLPIKQSPPLPKVRKESWGEMNTAESLLAAAVQR